MCQHLLYVFNQCVLDQTSGVHRGRADGIAALDIYWASIVRWASNNKLALKDNYGTSKSRVDPGHQSKLMSFPPTSIQTNELALGIHPN